MPRRYYRPGPGRAGRGFPVFRVGCLAVAIISMVGAFAFLASDRDRVRQPAEEDASGPTDIRTVISDHLAHPQIEGAAGKYVGRVVTLSGVVASSQWHTMKREGAFITLDNVEGRHTVAATFKWPREDEALGLSQGQRVKVKGEIISSVVFRDSGIVTLMLTKCELVR